ncbi:hypothetical protein HY949_04465 [Candidatus Gottesmanbacteria bacterium]|nr:hypothetical protein [Candidatus Gottesmanbacteria bacterium]
MNKYILIAVGIVGFLAVITYIQYSTQSKYRESTQQTQQYAPLSSSRYQLYSQQVFELAKDKKRILYFHADWCPTCRLLDKEISANINAIPENIILYKTNYDTEAMLKKKYAITYQHTFVQVDAQGNEVTKWSGGGIEALMESIK